MTEVCVFCLSKDRTLFPIPDTQWVTFYSLLDTEDAQYIKYLQSESLLRVCWECRARITGLSSFVRNAQFAVRLLREYWACPTEIFPSSQSKLGQKQTEFIDYPPLDPKTSAVELDKIADDDNKQLEIFGEAADVKIKYEATMVPKEVGIAAGSSNIKSEEDDYYDYSQEDHEDRVENEIPKENASCPPAKNTVKRKTRSIKSIKTQKSSKHYTVSYATTNQAERWFADECASRRQDGCHTCDECGTSFVNKHELDTHFAQCHNESAGSLICNICKSRFPTECHLKEHIEAHFTLYKCNKCNYETRTLSAIKSHKKYEHDLAKNDNSDIENREDKKKKIHECKKCKNTFDNIIILRKHRKKCNTFQCDFCEKSFTHRTSKYSHMDLHHKPLPEVECNICKKKFKNKYAIKSHMQKHSKEAKGLLYYCDVCQIDYKTAIKFRQHFLKNMRQGPEYRNECYHCVTKFLTPKRLQEHITTAHMRRGAHKCTQCYKTYTQLSKLQAHMRNKHVVKQDKTRDKICHVCGKGFTSSTILQNHLRSHTGERPFKCPLCSARFAHTGSLYTHAKLVHRKRAGGRIDTPMYPCTECSKEFVSEARLKSHFDFFHLKKSEFVCDICNKIFISAWNLKNHKTMLHGINRTRSFPCNICGKEFFRVDALKSHKLIHSEERTFMCSECGKTFKQQAALYTHNKLVHKGMKRPPAKSKRGKKTDADVTVS